MNLVHFSVMQFCAVIDSAGLNSTLVIIQKCPNVLSYCTGISFFQILSSPTIFLFLSLHLVYYPDQTGLGTEIGRTEIRWGGGS